MPSPSSPRGNPRSTGKSRARCWAVPFAALRCRSTRPGASGPWATASPGSSTRWNCRTATPPLHLAPRGWPTYPRERWPFILALLGVSGALLALLARHLAGLPALKPGTSPLLLLAFPALYFYLFVAWRVATRGAGLEVALEGELARRLRAWGRWEPIGENTPLGQALLEARRVFGPFWLRLEGGRLYLAFMEKFCSREEAGLRGELGALEGLLRALGELHPER